MPTFQITGPDGRKFRVTGATAEGALAAVKAQAGQPSQAPATQPPPSPDQRGNLADTFFQGALGGFGDEIQGVSSGVRSVVNGGSFGQGYSQGKANANADLAAVRERQPIASAATEFAGGFAPAALIPASGIVRGAGLASKVANGVVSGAATGALFGAGNSEGDLKSRAVDTGVGALAGGVMGAALPVAGRVIGKVVGNRAAAAATPTVQSLKQESQALYQSAEKQGVQIAPRSFVGAVDRLMSDLRTAGINPKQQPKSFETFNILRRAREAAANGAKVKLRDMETLRQIAGNVLKDADPNERRVSHVIVDGIDDFMSNLKPHDVIAGNGKAAVAMLHGARELWKRQSKGAIIESLFERAKNAVGANYTAAGMETAVRQKFRSLADNPRAFSRFSKEEQNAIKAVVRGAPVQNALRFIGKFAPTGFFSGAGIVGLGAATSAPVAALAAGGALAAKTAARKMASRSANRASLIVRNGGTMPYDRLAAIGAENRANSLLRPAGQVGLSALVDRPKN